MTVGVWSGAGSTYRINYQMKLQELTECGLGRYDFVAKVLTASIKSKE